MGARLMSIEECMVSQALIPPDYETTKKQQEEHEALQDLIDQQEQIVQKLLESGEEILEATDAGEERDTVQLQLADIKKRCDAVKTKAAEREEKLQKVLPEAKEYYYVLQDFEPWLTNAEKKLDNVKVDTPTEQEIAKQLQILNDLEDETEKHKPDLETLNKDAEFLTGNC